MMTKEKALEYLVEKIRWDEPVFILRGGDILAVPTIFKWAELAKDFRAPSKKVEGAIESAGEFLRYDGVKKIPD